MGLAQEIIVECGPVVVGTGAAGLLAALSMAPQPVVLVGAGQPGSSDLAQGGIAAATGTDDADRLHAADTLAASSGLCDAEIVDLVTASGSARIALLEKLGMPFDREEDGSLSRGREAAHQVSRVVHAYGDGTGRALTETLWRHVKAAPHIQILSPALAERLLVEGGCIRGLVLETGRGALILKTNAVVLATGGIGQLFSRTTNPAGVCGLGLGMAIRAGAKVADMEFVQFHPTAIDIPGQSPNPLATEALRGEGAVLVNGAGRRFMEKAHPLAELAPRDVVARAVFREVQTGDGAYLDAREAIGAAFEAGFPTVYQLCRAHGIDPVREPIPVAPAAHYHMGGVAVDRNGRTSLPGLWACGEVASTGLHGANRLASNSLLEALVFAPLVAEDLCRTVGGNTGASLPDGLISSVAAEETPAVAVPEWLRDCLYRGAGLVRDEQGLREQLALVTGWHPDGETEMNIRAVALCLVTAALGRPESRGGHFRSDYPLTRDSLARRAVFTAEAVPGLRDDAEYLDVRNVGNV